MEHKSCKKCGISKPRTLEYFIASSSCKDGIGIYCRECRREYNKAWKKSKGDTLRERRRQVYRERYKDRHAEVERQRAEREPFRVTAENLISGIRERQKVKGYDVSAEMKSKAYVEAWLRRQPRCECCEEVFVLGRKGTGRMNWRSPSIDRVDNDEGYTLGNVALICWRCNAIKKDATADELRTIADWLERKTTKFGRVA